MKRRQYSRIGDRSLGNQGKVVLMQPGPRAVAAPKLKPGQVHCRVCRQATTLTTTGVYRSHRDLFGNPCGARSPQDVAKLDAVPDVILPPEPKECPPSGRVETERHGVRSSGECQECGCLVSGERRYCGRCLMHRDRDRKRKG